MSGLLSLLLAIAVFVIEHTLYGWIAAKLLKYDGSWLRNFIIGCIGDFASTFVVIVVIVFFELLHIEFLVGILTMVSNVLSLMLPVLGTLAVMYIYKS